MDQLLLFYLFIYQSNEFFFNRNKKECIVFLINKFLSFLSLHTLSSLSMVILLLNTETLFVAIQKLAVKIFSAIHVYWQTSIDYLTGGPSPIFVFSTRTEILCTRAHVSFQIHFLFQQYFFFKENK